MSGKASAKLMKKLHPLGPKSGRLHPQFAPPETWRTWGFKIVFDENDVGVVVRYQQDPKVWAAVRERILHRDNHTCRYCGFRAPKWQVVHHIDGNPKNSDANNLETVCWMCNMVLHAGLHAYTIDLYRESRYTQADVVRRSRALRAQGKDDKEIVKGLGLRCRVKFEMDRPFLRGLVAFVSSRCPRTADPTARALEYGYKEIRKQLGVK